MRRLVLYSGVSLFRASDPEDQHDVLASNLLFATLLIGLGEYVFSWVTTGFYVHSQSLPAHAPWWRQLALLLLYLLLRSGLYYSIRVGLLAAKGLFALGIVVYACTKLFQDYSYVLTHSAGLGLLLLVRTLLTLAALGLMFTKPRTVSRRILE